MLPRGNSLGFLGIPKSCFRLFQFLLEAVFLCLIGGVIGVALGVGVGNMITLVFPSIEAVVPIDWVFI